MNITVARCSIKVQPPCRFAGLVVYRTTYQRVTNFVTSDAICVTRCWCRATRGTFPCFGEGETRCLIRAPRDGVPPKDSGARIALRSPASATQHTPELLTRTSIPKRGSPNNLAYSNPLRETHLNEQKPASDARNTPTPW